MMSSDVVKRRLKKLKGEYDQVHLYIRDQNGEIQSSIEIGKEELKKIVEDMSCDFRFELSSRELWIDLVPWEMQLDLF
jgi:uncharacterized protein YjbJ (UPF0337 family)